MAQKLCFFANSHAVPRARPRVPAHRAAFQDGGYNFAALVKELFSSPLVTGAVADAPPTTNGVPISIARRDQLCAALSNRLGKPDLCAQAAPLPASAQTATAAIASQRRAGRLQPRRRDRR